MIPAARCYDHKDEAKLPQLCSVCQRIAVEHKIVKKTIKTLLAAGYLLSVNDGEGVTGLTIDEATLYSHLFDLDDAYLEVFRRDAPSVRLGWVRFVFGNDGFDVISDYTTSLEEILKPVNEYANRFDI